MEYLDESDIQAPLELASIISIKLYFNNNVPTVPAMLIYWKNLWSNIVFQLFLSIRTETECHFNSVKY